MQLGAQSLGLSTDRQLTRTGGLAFAGGPWNNYVMHAIATVVGDLREQPGEHGLVWANGGYATKHAFGVYGTEPPAAGFRHDDPQAEIDALPSRRLASVEDAAGPATIEAYTVMHGRDGAPEQAIATCLLADGRRAWGLSSDADVMGALLEGEWVGTAVDPRRHRRRSTSDRPVDGRRGRLTAMAVPMILDCDPGHDDAVAIVVAARHAELLGITTVAGNAPLERTTAQRARRPRPARRRRPGAQRGGPPARRRAAHGAGRARRQRARRGRPPGAHRGRSTAPTPSASSSRRAAPSRACGSSASAR